jgi:hypothetical protein
MTELHQRWLSLSGISTVLNLTPTQIKTLHKQRLLVRIGKNPSEYRYLDPTPEYAERLRLAAVMLSKNSQVNIDLPMTFLLTIREVAEIMGWSLTHARHFLDDSKAPCWKAKNRAKLYSVSTVRDLLFKRQGRKLSKQRDPFLLSDLINYFRRFQVEEEAIVPTDAEFAEDAELQKKIVWMMKQPSPQREAMLADFLEKVELAKQVVTTAKGIASPESVQ